MIWADKMALLRVLTATALAAGVAGAAVAGPVVVRATGPSARAYPAGRQLADGAQLSLARGDTVVLLDARGTRTLTGPGSFPAVGSGSRTTTAGTAGRILANQTSSERRGGAVRGGAPDRSAESPNIFFIDPTRSGTLCVADANAATLWRPVAAQESQVRISWASGTGQVTMPRGATMAAWPKSVPIVNGGEYTLSLDNAAPAKVKLVTLAAVGSTEEVAAQLIAKGCTAQLDQLIATLNRSNPAG